MDTHARDGVLRLPGVRLAWRAVGRSAGPPLVALHGMCSRGATWNRFAQAAVARGRRVVTLDLRGHGDSSRPGRYGCRAMRDDVLALLDAQGSGPVDLVGHSLGGHVATLVAQHSPARVRRLVVEDASPPPADARDVALRTTRQRVALAAQSALLLAKVRQFDVRMVRPVLREVLATPDPEWWAALPALRVPTLLLSGGDTSHVAAGRLAAVVRAMPDCRLVTIPDAGHRIHTKHHDRFTAAVLPFLAA